MEMMQIACNHQPQTLKSRMQHDNMNLHTNLSKFHIGHDQNGATVQQLQSTQDVLTICPKQQHSTLQVSKQQATVLEHGIKWHVMVVHSMELESFNMGIIIGAIDSWQSSKQYATIKHADSRKSGIATIIS